MEPVKVPLPEETALAEALLLILDSSSKVIAGPSTSSFYTSLALTELANNPRARAEEITNFDIV
ncbi:hypothetical protein [Niallia sp. FSL R7-0271]|uniref:hypothetical protein n=1 Tax=Niallia sp. FSL R7-0271 TaxID=2921678 RepID=UPI0030FAA1FE